MRDASAHALRGEPTDPIDIETLRLAVEARNRGTLSRLKKCYQVVALWLIEHPTLDPESVTLRDLVNVDSGPRGNRFKVGAGRADRGWNIAVSLYRQTIAAIFFRKQPAGSIDEPAFMDGDVAITKAMLLEQLRALEQGVKS